MSDITPEQSRARFETLRGSLPVFAMLSILAGCIAALVILANPPQNGTLAGTAIAGAIACVAGGIVLAAVLFALSAVVGLLASTTQALQSVSATSDVRPSLDRLEESLRLLNNLSTAPGGNAARSADLSANGGTPQHLLEQIRDLTLMDESQRQRLAARHWARRKQTHSVAIEREVLIGDWRSAFARLDELQVVLPDDPQVAELRERVESEQNARLDVDLRNVRNRLRQHTTAAQWQQAEELAAALQNRYPGKAEIVRLTEDLRREKDEWERQTMERRFKDISAATSKKQYRQAALAVAEFIRHYPFDPRSEALRLDLPTLQENAAGADRKEQEEHFKDLLKHQNFAEAAAVARAVIQKYPQSPTATELNKLLPRVEEAARQATQNAAVAAAV